MNGKGVEMQVSSIYPHIRPTMVTINKDVIAVIGGENSIKCELFHLRYNKWRVIDDLPGERYGAVAVLNPVNDNLYLIGGMNTKTNEYYQSILCIYSKNFNYWEEIKIDCGDTYLTRKFCCAFISSSSKITIVGGSSNNSEMESSVDINLTKRTSEPGNIKLDKNIEFIYSNVFQLNNKDLYLLAQDMAVIKLESDVIRNNQIQVHIKDSIKYCD